MRKINIFFYLFFAFAFVFTSCSENENVDIVGEDKSVLEPDFFENDGSQGLVGEERAEEEAPNQGSELATKTYYHNYTLLKPSGLHQSDVNEMKCGETKSMPLLVGSRKKKVGTVEVSNDDEHLYLTVSADRYKYLKKIYFYIGDKSEIPFYSNGFPKLYDFNFKAFPYYYGGQRKATYKIPLSSIDADCFEIVAFAKVFDKYSWCYYSAFAYNPELTQRYYYSYQTGCYYFRDWVRSFDYCKESCGEEPRNFVFGRKDIADHRTCLDVNINGNSYEGWSNNIAYSLLLAEPDTQHFLKMYSGADGCDISNGTFLGSVKVSLADNGKDIKLIFFLRDDNNLVMSDVSLYVGNEENPYNADGSVKSSIPASSFYQETFATNIKESAPIIMPFDGDADSLVYIISAANTSLAE